MGEGGEGIECIIIPGIIIFYVNLKKKKRIQTQLYADFEKIGIMTLL